MKIKASALLKAMEGGQEAVLCTRRLKDGRTIFCAMPDFSERELSDKQKEQKARFKEATVYAHKASKTEPIYAQLVKGRLHTAYNVAMTDWFHAPEIMEVDVSAWEGKAGQVIRVLAMDNVKVTQVKVLIVDVEGVLLEEGDACQDLGFWWSYTTTASAKGGAKVVVRAYDLPGNVTEVIWGDEGLGTRG